MATAAPGTDFVTLADLLRQLGDIPAVRVVMDPAPGTATERDVLEIHRRTKRLCELVDATLVDKSPFYHEGSAAELLERLGNIPPERVRLKPAPGTATEQDVLDAWDRDRRLCELIDGTLVEKTVGLLEGYLAMWLGYFITDYLVANDIGLCAGADAMMRIAPHMVRIPDVSFIAWDRLGARVVPNTPIPDLYPNLAVEVISKGNSKAEMGRKLREYFAAGVSLVWYIYPDSRTACVFTSPDEVVEIGPDGTLDGGAVLPGFVLPMADLFSRVA